MKNKENKAEKEIIEVLENSGFEEGTKGWTTQQPGTLTEVTDVIVSGEKAVKVTDRTLTASGPKQVITGKIKAGQKVNVSAKVKYDEGPDVRTFNICIQNNKDGNVWDGIETAATAEVKKESGRQFREAIRFRPMQICLIVDFLLRQDGYQSLPRTRI